MDESKVPRIITPENKLEKEKYVGAYTIELQGNPSMEEISHIPDGLVTVSEKKVAVNNGTAYQAMGGIQFYAGETPFHFSYANIKKIISSDGTILWQNRKQEE